MRRESAALIGRIGHFIASLPEADLFSSFRHRLRFLVALALAGCASDAHPPRASNTGAVGVSTATPGKADAPPVVEASTKPPASPTLDDVLGAIDVHPPRGSSVALVGLRSETNETYETLYDTGMPSFEGPSYRTLAIVSRPGAAIAMRWVSHLAIPAPGGFVLAHEAVCEIDPGQPTLPDGSEEGPSWYAATEVVMASTPTELARKTSATRKKLCAARKGGIATSRSIVYASPRALCVEDSEAEWTGGALAFSGTICRHLWRVAAPVELPLLAYADERAVIAFGREVLARQVDADDEVSLDDEIDLGWMRKATLRKDAMACLGRSEGHPMLVGAMELSGNSARTFTAEAPVSEVPAAFGVHRGSSIALATVRAALPDAVDVMLSPGGDLLLVVEKTRIDVLDVAAAKVVDHVDIGGAQVVMEEWATDDLAESWLAALAR